MLRATVNTRLLKKTIKASNAFLNETRVRISEEEKPSSICSAADAVESLKLFWRLNDAARGIRGNEVHNGSLQD